MNARAKNDLRDLLRPHVPAAVEGLAAIASNLKHYDSINRVYGLPRQMLQALRVHYNRAR
jgi:hypothetical protein